MAKNDVAIKWSGSKRSQAKEIVSRFPKEIETYYEPFCGGCSILYELFHSDIKCERFVASDLNGDLISLWNAIKTNPEVVADRYEDLWNSLKKCNGIAEKRNFFNSVRKEFNENKDATLFLFLLRTCLNGMPRYNSKGDFNTSFHLNRDGIMPDKLRKTLSEWSELLNTKNVEFKQCHYREIKPNKSDFVYMDPPYANTKGMYFGGIPLNEFWEYIGSLPCKWALSFDGKSGGENHTYTVPKIYDEHCYIKSGNSSFKRIKETDKNAVVFESLYLKKIKK